MITLFLRFLLIMTFAGTLHEVEIRLAAERARGAAEAEARTEMSRQ